MMLLMLRNHPRFLYASTRNLDRQRVSIESMTYIFGIVCSGCHTTLDSVIFVGSLMTLEPPDQEHQMQCLAAADLSRTNHHHITRS
jgi:hypothetical protein